MSPPTSIGSGSAVDGRLVANHQRVWARHTHGHRPRPRRDTPPGCAASSNTRTVPASDDDLARDLGDYDRAFGLTGEAI